VARMELFIEFLQFFEDLLHVRGRRNQIRDAEVITIRCLPEARARHRHDASFVDHLKAVDVVRRLTLGLSLLNKSLREMNLREGIHCALDLCARDLTHVVKGRGEESSSLFHAAENSILLLLIKFHTLL